MTSNQPAHKTITSAKGHPCTFEKNKGNTPKEKQNESLAKTVFLDLSPSLATSMIKNSRDNRSLHL